MSRSSTATRLGQRINAAILARGTDTESVARAAGMPAPEFESRLRTGDFSMPQVVRVGGFLCLDPTDLFGVAA